MEDCIYDIFKNEVKVGENVLIMLPDAKYARIHFSVAKYSHQIKEFYRFIPLTDYSSKIIFNRDFPGFYKLKKKNIEYLDVFKFGAMFIKITDNDLENSDLFKNFLKLKLNNIVDNF